MMLSASFAPMWCSIRSENKLTGRSCRTGLSMTGAVCICGVWHKAHPMRSKTTRPPGKPDSPNIMEKVPLANVTADFELPDSPAKNVIDGNLKTHWSSDAGPVRRNQSRQFVFETQKSVGYDDGAALTFQLAQKRDDTIDTEQRQPNIGRFRISVTDAPNPKADPVPASVRAILSTPADRRSKEQRREVFSFYRTIDPVFVEANKKIDELMKEWPYGPTTLALSAREIPRETRLFKRGDWKRLGDVVSPGV